MSNSKTVIGPTAIVRGHIEGREDLQIEGHVEGTISLSETLIIEASGIVHADVNVQGAVIYGVLVGNIEAAQMVKIGAGGRVVGDIQTPEFILEEGGAYRGRIDMGDFDLNAKPTSIFPPQETRAPVPKPIPSPTSASLARSAKEPPSPRSPGFSPRTAPSAEPTHRIQTGGGGASWTAPASSPFAKAPVPVPRASGNVAPVPSPAPKKPAAPAPKVRNIGRAKARRQSR